jgi:tRNA (cytidine/uridine-2'-O-)-methyltransferase
VIGSRLRPTDDCRTNDCRTDDCAEPRARRCCDHLQVFRIVFVEPRIPPNTGNAIRLAAVTGCELHLVDPLFDLSDAKLRRAGLDYHDLASVTVHPDMEAAWAALLPGRVFAFTARGRRSFADIAYQPGDLLVFGAEPTGLPEHVLDDPRVTEQVHIPMVPGVRSLNLSNAAAIAVYEAWRQHGFAQPHPPRA